MRARRSWPSACFCSRLASCGRRGLRKKPAREFSLEVMLKEMRPQADRADQDQVEGDQVVEDTRQEQDQDTEDQGDDRLDRDDVDIGNGLHEMGSSHGAL